MEILDFLESIEWLDVIVFNNPARVWLLAGVTALVTLFGLWLITSVLLKRVSRITRRTRIRLDDLVVRAISGHTNLVILVLLSLYVGSIVPILTPPVNLWLRTAAIILLLIQVGIWSDALIRLWIAGYGEANLKENAEQVTTMRAVSFVLRLIVFSILLLVALDNIPGVEVTALIASLGIGGVAVALAVQNILGDLFASLSIALDKPFVIGDFIKVGEFAGRVENIGLKTTRIRSISGEQLIFANSDLLSSRVRNFNEFEERRVVFNIGVTYDTAVEKLRQIPDIVRQEVEALEDARFDRAHFFSFGDSALNFEIVYFVLTPDYTRYMDVQHGINMGIYERFAEKGIEFAFPTRMVYVAQEADGQQEQEVFAAQNGPSPN